MGYGMPAAYAAKLVHPDRAVVCVVGDGGFQMTAGELALARRLNLAVPVDRAQRRLAWFDEGQTRENATMSFPACVSARRRNRRRIISASLAAPPRRRMNFAMTSGGLWAWRSERH